MIDNPKLRFFLLVAEQRMLLNRMKVQLKMHPDGKTQQCKLLIHAYNVISVEIDRIIAKGMDAAMKAVPNGIAELYSELKIEQVKDFENGMAHSTPSERK